MEKFKTFDDWFFSIPDDNFGFRGMICEYFYDDVGKNRDNAKIMREWLRIAFEAARETE